MAHAELLAPAFSKHPGQLTPGDLSNLPNFAAYARLLIDCHPSNPFSLRTLPPELQMLDEERAEIVRRMSRHRYGKPTVQPQVEAKIRQELAAA